MHSMLYIFHIYLYNILKNVPIQKLVKKKTHNLLTSSSLPLLQILKKKGHKQLLEKKYENKCQVVFILHFFLIPLFNVINSGQETLESD